MLVPVILAGGVGSRLWPLSRENYPKQFIPLLDEEYSLMQSTLQRLEGIENVSPPMLVCNAEHRFMVAEQLRQLGIKDATILLEPVAKNTAPAVALAAIEAAAKNEEAVLLVLPADHLISSNKIFHKAIESGLAQAKQDKLVTFGIVPDRPETGYGYVKRANQMADGCFAVAEFVEKPDVKKAAEYVDSGCYYWNSGMFMFSAKAYLKELGEHAPDILEACMHAYDSIYTDLDFKRVDEQAFSECRSESIDYAVMENTRNAVVVPLDTGWNDVGAWAAIWDITDQDHQGNVVVGDVMLDNTQGSYIRSESRLVAGIGLKDLVVVETADAVLIADRQSVQDVKNIVTRLKLDARREITDHTRVVRPWGSYESIVNCGRFQAKRIVVNPGAQLSLQLHHHRAEHWVVVKGCGLVTKGEEKFRLNEDESTYIPIGTKHRLQNPGIIPLEIIEVQTGSYLGEDDIIRFGDDYGRQD